MALPIMPKATAVWLVENTALSFEQIADFCGMHSLEVQGIADGEVYTSITGQDPVANNQVAAEEIEKAEKDENYRMILADKAREHMDQKIKGARYTPVSRRQDKPEAIAWITKNHPYIPDSKIVKLIGTTKKTIESIRERTHWNISNIKGKDPVMLGLCMQMQLDSLVEKYRPAEDETPEAESETA
ncbi:MAG: DUF1013 domain-containing protein [Rickettsiales bacterium]|nr:DUF1013 domain-containing protein [Rickettsiales bacterium]